MPAVAPLKLALGIDLLNRQVFSGFWDWNKLSMSWGAREDGELISLAWTYCLSLDRAAGLQQWIYMPGDWLSDACFQLLQAWNKSWSAASLQEMFTEIFWAFLRLKPELLRRKHQTKMPRNRVPRRANWKIKKDLCLWVPPLALRNGFMCSAAQNWHTKAGFYKLSLKKAHLQEDTHVLSDEDSLQNRKHMRSSSPHLSLLWEVLQAACWMGRTNPSASFLLKLYVLGYSIAYLS